MSDRFDHEPDFGPIRKRTPGRRFRPPSVFLWAGILAGLLVWASPWSTRCGPAMRHAACVNNLKQIGLALRTYEQEHGALPPACTVDASGRRLHSWRVLILPYLGWFDTDKAMYDNLLKSIDLSRPWDDPVNAKAAAAMPSVFECPDMPQFHGRGLTTYMASVAPGGCLRAGKPRPLAEITDPHDETLMAIEAGEENAVPWMAPADADEFVILGITPESKLPQPGGVHALFVDGSVKLLEPDLPASARRALISIAGHDDPAGP
ncbi:hypothetical protein OJF2_01480 [Aquisphaera giovannonii]|uniref:DUF1559 domain-containing protein n=1 Tax=Aquisphaera giovannonii TaxID=406548 RepID=A0A5B9VTK8_9BACT|nr:DUF1559 domain-containing protein [Aquisphaera giovannonii]QEH31683.1 hypothetical protein OJF2_01480 [Aquisphaera giovannonii]